MNMDAGELSQANDEPREGEMSEREIDENLEGTFPASDPPAWTLGTDHRAEVKPAPETEADDD
jgi:hypothetical protein